MPRCSANRQTPPCCACTLSRCGAQPRWRLTWTRCTARNGAPTCRCNRSQAYAQRLQALSHAQSPAQAPAQSLSLVAHVYVRYLGDLHGGQILKRLVARSLGLVGDSGTHFYAFGDETQVLALRQGLRLALGSLGLNSADSDAVVTEARWAFVQHQQLFTELADAA